MSLSKEWDVSITWEEANLLKHICDAKANEVIERAPGIGAELKKLSKKFREVQELIEEQPWEDE